jgi:hypothetical protein
MVFISSTMAAAGFSCAILVASAAAAGDIEAASLQSLYEARAGVSCAFASFHQVAFVLVVGKCACSRTLTRRCAVTSAPAYIAAAW